MTIREGQHIPKQNLTKGHIKGNIPIIDSKNMGRYSFSWNPLICYDNSKSNRKFATTKGRRILIRKTGDSIISSITPEIESYVLQSVYQSIQVTDKFDPEFILGLLNSKFLTYVYQSSDFGQKGRTMAQFRKGNLDRLPMPTLDLDNKEDNERYGIVVRLVRRMLDLNNQKSVARTGQILTQLERQLNSTDEQIDRLVYELYQLTPDEIATIEG